MLPERPSQPKAPFAGRYDSNLQPIFLTAAPPLSQQRYGGFYSGPIVKDKVFYFGGIERLQMDSSDVLGISDYWRQFVSPTVVPTGERETVGMAKVDANIDQNNRVVKLGNDPAEPVPGSNQKRGDLIAAE